MNAPLTGLLLIFGAGYLVYMAVTGEIGTRSGVFWRRTEDPTAFWVIWALFAAAYVGLLCEGVPTVLAAIR